jgi:hypothetical protein
VQTFAAKTSLALKDDCGDMELPSEGVRTDASVFFSTPVAQEQQTATAQVFPFIAAHIKLYSGKCGIFFKFPALALHRNNGSRP